MAGRSQAVEEALNRLFGRTSGAAHLDCLQSDAVQATRCPTVQRRCMGLPATFRLGSNFVAWAKVRGFPRRHRLTFTLLPKKGNPFSSIQNMRVSKLWKPKTETEQCRRSDGGKSCFAAVPKKSRRSDGAAMKKCLEGDWRPNERRWACFRCREDGYGNYGETPCSTAKSGYNSQ